MHSESHSLNVIKLDDPPAGFLEDEIEDGAFCRAFQVSGLDEFTIFYLAVYRGDQRVAVAPCFTMDFRLNTMFPESWLSRMTNWLKLRMAAVGHPSTDIGLIEGEGSAEVLSAINRELGHHANLIVYKGFGDDMPLPGFVRATGLPVPVLKIEGDYYSGLNRHRRQDFRQKQRKAKPLAVEEYRGALPPGMAEVLHGLYMQTHRRAEVRFECVTAAYFDKTAPMSTYIVFSKGDRAVGFAQLMSKKSSMAVKYVGMDYDYVKEFGLYFALFFKAIDICLRDGITRLDGGVTAYPFKHRLGSVDVPTFNYYRHKNPLLNWFLGKFKSLIEP